MRINGFIKKVAIFSLCLPIIWVLGVCLYGSIFPRYLQKNLVKGMAREFTINRLLEADTVKNVDVLVLGSSHAYRGFDPRIFEEHGIRMFNIGTSAQTAIQTEYLVNKYIDKIKPKMVIYEASYMNLTGDGLESALDLYYSIGKPDEELLNMVLKINKIKSYNTFLFGLYEKYIRKREKQKVNFKTASNTYITGGFVETRLATDINKQKAILTNQRKIKALYRDMQIEAFKATMEALKKRDIQTIIVQAPVLKDTYESISNQGEIDAFFSSFKGIPYLKYNKTLSLPSDDFYDDHHLNQKGVQAFNRKLIKDLNTVHADTMVSLSGN